MSGNAYMGYVDVLSVNMDKIIEIWKELFKRKSYVLIGLYILLAGVYLSNNEFIIVAMWIRNMILSLIPLEVVISLNLIISSLYKFFYENWFIFTALPILIVFIHTKWLHKWFLFDKLLWRLGIIKVIKFMWINGYVIKATIAFVATGMVEVIGFQSWASIALNGILIIILIFDRLFT